MLFKKQPQGHIPTARVDIILFIADRNEWRKITLLMSTCCDFLKWLKFLLCFMGGSKILGKGEWSVGVSPYGDSGSEVHEKIFKIWIVK